MFLTCYTDTIKYKIMIVSNEIMLLVKFSLELLCIENGCAGYYAESELNIARYVSEVLFLNEEYNNSEF